MYKPWERHGAPYHRTASTTAFRTSTLIPQVTLDAKLSTPVTRIQTATSSTWPQGWAKAGSSTWTLKTWKELIRDCKSNFGLLLAIILFRRRMSILRIRARSKIISLRLLPGRLGSARGRKVGRKRGGPRLWIRAMMHLSLRTLLMSKFCARPSLKNIRINLAILRTTNDVMWSKMPKAKLMSTIIHQVYIVLSPQECQDWTK